MNLPEKLPILRIEDYHTHYLGRVNDGRLFWGYETFVFTKPYSEIKEGEWKKFRKEYAILHTFDSNGNLLETKNWSKFTDDDSADTSDMLDKMCTGFGSFVYNNIEIKVFQTIIDGIAFGLIPNSETNTIDLQPSSTISFSEPWDGEYYT